MWNNPEPSPQSGTELPTSTSTIDFQRAAEAWSFSVTEARVSTQHDRRRHSPFRQ
jgi:hypothetical protein